MKKFGTICLLALIILQSCFIYSLYNKPNVIQTKYLTTVSQPKIIYKDRIVYKDKIIKKSDDIDIDIENAVALFLQIKDTNINGETRDFRIDILNSINAYNKKHKITNVYGG
jgi:hypothetical protein